MFLINILRKWYNDVCAPNVVCRVISILFNMGCSNEDLEPLIDILDKCADVNACHESVVHSIKNLFTIKNFRMILLVKVPAIQKRCQIQFSFTSLI